MILCLFTHWIYTPQKGNSSEPTTVFQVRTVSCGEGIQKERLGSHFRNPMILGPTFKRNITYPLKNDGCK